MTNGSGARGVQFLRETIKPGEGRVIQSDLDGCADAGSGSPASALRWGFLCKSHEFLIPKYRSRSNRFGTYGAFFMPDNIALVAMFAAILAGMYALRLAIEFVVKTAGRACLKLLGSRP